MKKRNPKKLTLQEITEVYILLDRPKISGLSEFSMAVNLFHRSKVDVKKLFELLYGMRCPFDELRPICMSISFALSENRFLDFCKFLEK